MVFEPERSPSLSVAASICAYRMFCCTTGDPEFAKCFNTIRKCPTLSVDDTHNARDAKKVSYCYNWWSATANQPVKGQNILGITIKIGKINIPLNMCLVSKQGRGNTDKPSCFVSMLKEILDFFDAEGVNLWQSQNDILRKMGFDPDTC